MLRPYVTTALSRALTLGHATDPRSARPAWSRTRAATRFPRAWPSSRPRATRTARAARAVGPALPAVDHHGVGKRLVFGDPPREVAGHDLVHRREIVLGCALDLEPPVLRLLGAPTLEPDQRAYRVAPLVGRDVDAHERARHD